MPTEQSTEFYSTQTSNEHPTEHADLKKKNVNIASNIRQFTVQEFIPFKNILTKEIQNITNGIQNTIEEIWKLSDHINHHFSAIIPMTAS